MNWLILLYFLELGYSPFYNSLNVLPEDYEYIKDDNVYYVNFNAEVLMFNHLFIGGSTKTYIQPNNKENDFYPVQNDYQLNAGIRYKNIEIGMIHLCIHPGDSVDMQPIGKSYSGYEEFYIRLSNGF